MQQVVQASDSVFLPSFSMLYKLAHCLEKLIHNPSIFYIDILTGLVDHNFLEIFENFDSS